MSTNLADTLYYANFELTSVAGSGTLELLKRSVLLEGRLHAVAGYPA